jgi:hypothetical protein
LINLDLLIETGMISAGDVNLFCYVETAEEAWAHLASHYGFDIPPETVGRHAEDM